MHLLPQARIIVVAQQCISDIQTLFKSVNVTSQNLEVLGFVTMGLDFVFQSMTKDNIYRRELNALISHLSHTYKVPRNDIASVVAKRADMYAILISKALATMGVKLSDGTRADRTRLGYLCERQWRHPRNASLGRNNRATNYCDDLHSRTCQNCRGPRGFPEYSA